MEEIPKLRFTLRIDYATLRTRMEGRNGEVNILTSKVEDAPICAIIMI